MCKRAPATIAEALECLGGNGYVEESILPRLYREAPVNSIWEGAGNVVCLDVLRALAREPDSLEALLAELQSARAAPTCGSMRRLVRLSNALADQGSLEPRARQLVEQLALALQASVLVQHAPAAVADAFCASRLSDNPGRQFGALPSGLDLAAICARAMPAPRIAKASPGCRCHRCRGRPRQHGMRRAACPPPGSRIAVPRPPSAKPSIAIVAPCIEERSAEAPDASGGVVRAVSAGRS